MSKRLKLISSDEATPAGKQITKPCSDCPWSRTALNGWLGGNTAEEWIQMVHGETIIECHVHPDVQCAGAAIYRANVCKRLRDRKALTLPADRESVFARPTEFVDHHEKSPAKVRVAETKTWDCTRCDGSGDDPDGGPCDCCGGTGKEGDE